MSRIISIRREHRHSIFFLANKESMETLEEIEYVITHNHLVDKEKPRHTHEQTGRISTAWQHIVDKREL